MANSIAIMEETNAHRRPFRLFSCSLLSHFHHLEIKMGISPRPAYSSRRATTHQPKRRRMEQ
ncbi:hypothetical protein [Azospirillum largimobile]